MRDNHDTGNIVRNRERSEGKEMNETCETEYKRTRGGLVFFSPTSLKGISSSRSGRVAHRIFLPPPF